MQKKSSFVRRYYAQFVYNNISSKKSIKKKLDMVIWASIIFKMKRKIISIPGRDQKLEILANREIVCSILNLSHIFEYRSWYWCTCTRFQGCPLENGEENYCYICKLKFDYCINEMFKIRKLKRNYWYLFVYEKRFSWNNKIWSNSR